MSSSVGPGGFAKIRYRLSVVLALAAFGGYYSVTALGDLIPVEHFGASFTTSGQTSVVTVVNSASPAGRAGLQPGDEIVLVGGLPVRNALDWAAAFARIETGRAVPIVVRRSGVTATVSTTFRRRPGRVWENREELFIVLARVAQLVTLLFAIAIGVGAGGRRDVLGAWLLATISIYSVGLPPRMAVFWEALPFPFEPLLFVPSISKVLIGFIFFTFFCALVKVRLSRRRLLALGAPFAVLVFWDVLFLTALLHAPAWIPHLTGFLPLVIATNFSYVIAALVMLGVNYRTLGDPSDRRRLRWIVAGSVLGCAAGAPTVAGLWLGVGNDPTLIYHSPVWLQLVYMAFLVMPASFWWAIARGQLFDLRFVARRGLQYVFARHGLLVITPAAIGLLAVEAAAFHDDQSFRTLVLTHAWLYFGVAAALIVFRRRRVAWLDRVDRRLFRERYDAVQLLREVASQIRSSRDLKTAAAYAVSQIDAALHPEWLAVFSAASRDAELSVLAGNPPSQTWRPQSVVEPHATGNSAARLVAPAAADPGGVETLFVLGAKRSGEPYSREDQNLVHAIAEAVGYLAVSRSHRAEAEDETRTREAAGWDQRLWSLADAVASGTRVDWTRESSEALVDERRQVLLELQALERLMQVHGAPSDRQDLEADVPSAPRRWGDFELREQIGAGRFGTVYRAWDPKLERDVALKLLDVADVDRASYLREARHLARVRHPNVVHVYGADEHDDIPGFWMELVEGRTLSEDVRQRGPFGVEELSAIGGALCRALAAIHRAGLVHQDVKAQNVMRETDSRLVLMDLGAGIGIGHDSRPQSGTPRYMAPELFDGGQASPRSDLYSLGVLLFFLATGTFPVDGGSYEEIARHHRERSRRSLRDLRPDLPASVLDAVDRALSPDPLHRHATADELSASILIEAVGGR